MYILWEPNIITFHLHVWALNILAAQTHMSTTQFVQILDAALRQTSWTYYTGLDLSQKAKKQIHTTVWILICPLERRDDCKEWVIIA